jgi:hypothetical protein
MDGILEGDARLGKGKPRKQQDEDNQGDFHSPILPQPLRDTESTPSSCVTPDAWGRAEMPETFLLRHLLYRAS